MRPVTGRRPGQAPPGAGDRETGPNVGRTFAESSPWWETKPTARADAPNIIVVLVDDMGFSDVGCYGSEIPTPNIDKLAEHGLRYTNFHVTPKCSPTRASLMTGLNHHEAGYADVVHYDPGFPNYQFELPPDVPTLAGHFRASGYATLMLGKWHLAKESHVSADGPRDSWPLQCGFDQYYGFLDGFTNLHQPHELVLGNSLLNRAEYPDGYYLTDDLTQRAVTMIQEIKSANPSRPFFLYLAHGAMHAPLHAKAEDMSRHEGRFTDGWDALRRRRFERQKSLGVIPAHAKLPTNVEEGLDVPEWDSLDAAQQRLYCRYMEAYAGMLSSVDDNLGRLRDALEQLGELDNTIILFLSDNGASSEGGAAGTPCYLNTVSHLYTSLGDGTEPSYGAEKLRDLLPDDIPLEDIGGPHSMPHYPHGWARVSNTPFRLFKRQTHAGGHQVPLIVSWPAGINDKGGLRHQYGHVTDLLPTLLELTGMEGAAAAGTSKPVELAGRSFARTVIDSDAPGSHDEQYYEMEGNRGFYRRGWEVVARHNRGWDYDADEWELYHLPTDPTETNNLARAEPRRLDELTQAWEQSAARYNVFPLDDASGLKRILRSPQEEVLSRPVKILPGSPTLSRYRSRLLVQLRSFHVLVQLSGYKPGDEGVLVAHGDQGGGYVLYIEDGILRYAHTFANATRTVSSVLVPEGAGAIELNMTARSRGEGALSLSVDTKKVAAADGFDLFWGMTPFQGIDIGIDRRSPVSRQLHQQHGPFPYNGDIRSVVFEPGELAPDSPYRASPEELRKAALALRTHFD